MKKATKVRIYPTTEQAKFLNRQFGAVRFVYNKSLHIKNHYYRRHGIDLKANGEIKKLLPVAKKSRKYHWLSDFDSIALQQSCINLNSAFKNFFNPKLAARFPCFKSKRGRQTSYHCTSLSVGDDWIKVPKLDRIKARIHRAGQGTLKSITLSRTVTGKYYASLLFDDGEAAPAPVKHLIENQVLGVDMGLTHLAIDSTGDKTPNPRFVKRTAGNLRRKQKAMSRKKKGSRGRARARVLVATCHERVADARRDFQHKLSRHLVDDNQAIAVETLKVKNMLKNRKLSKAISDAAWSDLITKLDYKAKEAGKHLVKIDQWFASSKTCSTPGCHHKLDTLPLNVRHWTCPECGTKHDRDINGALNIKQQGILQLMAAGLTVTAN